MKKLIRIYGSLHGPGHVARHVEDHSNRHESMVDYGHSIDDVVSSLNMDVHAYWFLVL